MPPDMITYKDDDGKQINMRPTQYNLSLLERAARKYGIDLSETGARQKVITQALMDAIEYKDEAPT